jgi:hypothetical protein
MPAYTIEDVEKAINIWRSRRAASDDGALCPEARLLAAPYTMMFLRRQDTIDAAELSVEVRETLRAALEQGNLPV